MNGLEPRHGVEHERQVLLPREPPDAEDDGATPRQVEAERLDGAAVALRRELLGIDGQVPELDGRLGDAELDEPFEGGARKDGGAVDLPIEPTDVGGPRSARGAGCPSASRRGPAPRCGRRRARGDGGLRRQESHEADGPGRRELDVRDAGVVHAGEDAHERRQRHAEVLIDGRRQAPRRDGGHRDEEALGGGRSNGLRCGTRVRHPHLATVEGGLLEDALAPHRDPVDLSEQCRVREDRETSSGGAGQRVSVQSRPRRAMSSA